MPLVVWFASRWCMLSGADYDRRARLDRLAAGDGAADPDDQHRPDHGQLGLQVVIEDYVEGDGCSSR